MTKENEHDITHGITSADSSMHGTGVRSLSLNS